MKKVIILLFTGFLLSQGIHAQARQRKELLLQIAALQVYMDYAKKGYSAVSKSLNFIGDVKKGEVNLHGDYFTSLLKINPRVRNYYKTAEIISLQFKIVKMYKSTYAKLKTDDLFQGNELDYIARSFERLLESCNETLDQLLVLTTDSELELKDDQRIARIDGLHKTMVENYDFCLSFSNEAKLLSLSKSHEKRSAESAQSIYGLKN
ncbi:MULTISPECIES: hypothetical protein [Flavobacterium]|uniref:TerB family tellurite resistance protein n=1 Tax=Flavobacterium nitrogenifigens TaxID=1617283 RepID=A0A521F976_9FLAO|nr:MULTISPECIES: hypothetical protein [Flavobacterium]KAF2337780.1 hypothetical protein DM397_03620 [Flavobacterium nitrogenifigens]WDF66069.1 hypothetical protein PQ463_07845 [Flavobacterium sp. KACC 22763]SMO92171.1 hypothetical protein SAMN06265220_10719 [Flavobacterium nitrogenifigens]